MAAVAAVPRLLLELDAEEDQHPGAAASRTPRGGRAQSYAIGEQRHGSAQKRRSSLEARYDAFEPMVQAALESERTKQRAHAGGLGAWTVHPLNEEGEELSPRRLRAGSDSLLEEQYNALDSPMASRGASSLLDAAHDAGSAAASSAAGLASQEVQSPAVSCLAASPAASSSSGGGAQRCRISPVGGETLVSQRRSSLAERYDAMEPLTMAVLDAEFARTTSPTQMHAIADPGGSPAPEPRENVQLESIDQQYDALESIAQASDVREEGAMVLPGCPEDPQHLGSNGCACPAGAALDANEWDGHPREGRWASSASAAPAGSAAAVEVLPVSKSSQNRRQDSRLGFSNTEDRTVADPMEALVAECCLIPMAKLLDALAKALSSR